MPDWSGLATETLRQNGAASWPETTTSSGLFAPIQLTLLPNSRRCEFAAHLAFTEGETEWGAHLTVDEYPGEQ